MKYSASIILGILAATMIFAVAAAHGGVDGKMIQPPVAPEDTSLFPTGFRYSVFAETANGNVDSDPHQTTTYTTTTTTTTVVVLPAATPNPSPSRTPTNDILKATGPTATGGTVTHHHTTRRITSSDHILHNAVGGGVDFGYFFNRYFGVSLEGDFLGSYDYNTVLTGNLIFRYPFEFGAAPGGYSKDGKSTPGGPTWGLAPYAVIGGGGQWDGRLEGIGSIGGGVEFAFQHGYGIFVEGRWIVHDARQSYAAETAGLTFGF
jgi:hypothetical protein